MLVNYPLDGEDCDNENQSLNSSGEPYVNKDRHGGSESEYGDGYGPGHGERDRESNDGSGNENGDRTNKILIGKQ